VDGITRASVLKQLCCGVGYSQVPFVARSVRKLSFKSCCALTLLTLSAVPVFRADFEDVAARAGLTAKNVFGGLDHKDYILETTGTGVAIFDYDGDGRNDIFIANGTRFDSAQSDPQSRSQLYHNVGNGHFQEVG